MSTSEDDQSYLSMLNNPTINPGNQQRVQEQTTKGQLKPCEFPKVESAKALLVDAIQDQYLMSESDEPFEWINTVNDLNRLPTTEKELVQLGLLDKERGETIDIRTPDTFFRQHKLDTISEAFQKIGEEGKVYLIGEGSITVLILCNVKDTSSSTSALVGLRSLLVQT